jgi:hypothetical protein
MNGKERRMVIAVLAGFAAFGAWLNWYNPNHMSFVCQEDGFVEYSEAFLYLFAAGIFAYLGSQKGFRNIWYWGYAALFLLVAGEEVSWGQRIFDVNVPESFVASNVQHETNLHNMAGIHQHHHLYGFIVCITICFVIPLAVRWMPSLRRLCQKLKMPIYPLWTWSLPFIGFAFMVIPRLFKNNRDFKFDEMGELYLSLAFFGFALSAYSEWRKQFGRRRPAPIVRAAPLLRAA